jgi:hypothetical protein
MEYVWYMYRQDEDRGGKKGGKRKSENHIPSFR